MHWNQLVIARLIMLWHHKKFNLRFVSMHQFLVAVHFHINWIYLMVGRRYSGYKCCLSDVICFIFIDPNFVYINTDCRCQYNAFKNVITEIDNNKHNSNNIKNWMFPIEKWSSLSAYNFNCYQIITSSSWMN